MTSLPVYSLRHQRRCWSSTTDVDRVG